MMEQDLTIQLDSMQFAGGKLIRNNILNHHHTIQSLNHNITTPNFATKYIIITSLTAPIVTVFFSIRLSTLVGKSVTTDHLSTHQLNVSHKHKKWSTHLPTKWA